MNVGLPGTGIGGLFYLLTALLMPVAELIYTFQGRGSRERWRVALRQSALASGVIGGLWLTSLGVDFVMSHYSAMPHLQASTAEVQRMLGVKPTAWTCGTLAAVLLVAEFGKKFIARRAKPEAACGQPS